MERACRLVPQVNVIFNPSWRARREAPVADVVDQIWG